MPFCDAPECSRYCGCPEVDPHADDCRCAVCEALYGSWVAVVDWDADAPDRPPPDDTARVDILRSYTNGLLDAPRHNKGQG